MTQNLDGSYNFLSFNDNGLSLQLIGHHKLFDNSSCIGTCQFFIYVNDDGKMTQNHWFCQDEFCNCFENGMNKYLGSIQT